MAELLIILSGRVCCGKTTLAKGLKEAYGFQHARSSALLLARLGRATASREELQEYGADLDRKTQGRWIADDLYRLAQQEPDARGVVLDCVRAKSQVQNIRRGYRSRVFHIHLDVKDDQVLAARMADRPEEAVKETKSFKEISQHHVERDVPELANDADLVINTDIYNPPDALTLAASHVGLFKNTGAALVDVIVGGQYGSEGKGQIASFLAKEYDMLIRVGGPNAGHKVYEEPEPYTFHQLPSGTRSSNAKLLIGAGAAINKDVLSREIAQCKVGRERLVIDPMAIIIQKDDIDREQRSLQKTIGSTASGVGRAAIRRIERKQKTIFAKDVVDFRPFIGLGIEAINRVRCNGGRILLEGTQGTGLSLFHGPDYPNATSRDTTAAACISESGISPRCVRRIVMVCRTYPIRVESPKGGTSGVMSREIKWSEVAKRSRISLAELERCERTSTTNRPRRISEFDWPLVCRSASLNAPTDIALTFTDYINVDNRDARRFDQLTDDTIRFINEVEHVTNAPVSLISTRFHNRAIIDRRQW